MAICLRNSTIWFQLEITKVARLICWASGERLSCEEVAVYSGRFGARMSFYMVQRYWLSVPKSKFPGTFLGGLGFGLAFERMRTSNQAVTLKGDFIMKYTFICAAVLLAALFLGSGCATSSTSGGQGKAASPSHDVVSPAVAAPSQ